MTVEVKLFATLRSYLPSDSDGTSTCIELPAGAKVADVLRKLKIPAPEAQLVLVDGKHTIDRDLALENDCVISVFPAMAGGR